MSDLPALFVGSSCASVQESLFTAASDGGGGLSGKLIVELVRVVETDCLVTVVVLTVVATLQMPQLPMLPLPTPTQSEPSLSLMGR